MNKIVNNLLLAGDKFMPELHLRQPEFTYSPCGLYRLLNIVQKFKNLVKQVI